MLMRGIATALGTSICLVALAAPAQAQERGFDVPAGSLKAALDVYSRQADQPIIYKPEDLRGARSRGYKGVATARVALDTILANSGFVAQSGSTGAIAIVKIGTPQGNGLAGAPNADTESASSLGEVAESEKGIAEILVVGKRTQNADVRRTEDDPQPYVVFNSEQIERSLATNLEDFFRRRLPMNTSARQSSAQLSDQPDSSNVSSINLRGLGANQTLILVDGRPPARTLTLNEGFTQTDINAIPLASIERIEVLPATGGGIYGGGAVGGVINIIRKRDYRGVDMSAQYGGSLHGGAQSKRFDLNLGFSPNHGQTAISLSASYSKKDPLHVGDNDLYRRGRELRIKNNQLLPQPLLLPGYTTNIRSLAGDDLTLDNGTSLGSTITFVPLGYSGAGSDGGAAFVSNAGRFNYDLPDDGEGTLAYLSNATRVRSIDMELRHSFSRMIEAYINLNASDNYSRSSFFGRSDQIVLADAPSNPFQQNIIVSFPVVGQNMFNRSKATQYNARGGILARLSSKWSASIEYNWSRSKTLNKSPIRVGPINDDGFFAILDGTVDVLRDLNQYPVEWSSYTTVPQSIYGPFTSTARTASARASGSLLRLPGGNLSLNALVEHRSEKADKAKFFNDPILLAVAPRRQNVGTFYLELRAPLLGKGNAVPFVRELELQGSVRYDAYKTRVADVTEFDPEDPPPLSYQTSKFHHTDYTAAASWSPIEPLQLRASYSTGFLPPNISQLLSTTFQGDASFDLRDPRRGGEIIGTFLPFDIVTGGNPNLKPEASKSLSAGAIVRPLKGVRLSADYTKISKDDEINVIDFFTVLALEQQLPAGRVIRGPNLPGDPSGFPGPITTLDLTLLNIAKTNVSAVDFRADYDVNIDRVGDFRFYAIATRQLTFRRKFLPNVASFDTVDYADGPLKWRANLGLDWNRGPLSISWNAQFYSSYSVRLGSSPTDDSPVLEQGAERIPSQIYHDVYVQYAFPKNSALKGATLGLGIQNVFDKYPPAVADPLRGYSPYGDPRLRSFLLALKKHF